MRGKRRASRIPTATAFTLAVFGKIGATVGVQACGWQSSGAVSINDQTCCQSRAPVSGRSAADGRSLRRQWARTRPASASCQRYPTTAAGDRRHSQCGGSHWGPAGGGGTADARSCWPVSAATGAMRRGGSAGHGQEERAAWNLIPRPRMPPVSSAAPAASVPGRHCQERRVTHFAGRLSCAGRSPRGPAAEGEKVRRGRVRTVESARRAGGPAKSAAAECAIRSWSRRSQTALSS
jgi:hypothetical protein